MSVELTTPSEEIDAVRERVQRFQDRFSNLSPEEREQRDREIKDHERRTREAEAQLRRDIRLRGIPRLFQDASIHERPEVIEWVQQFLEQRFTKGLAICGPTGPGKSHLVWGIYRFLAYEDGPDMTILRSVTWLDEMRARTGYAHRDLLRSLAATPLLALEDIGSYRDPAFENDRLFELFDMRYEAMLPTIVTTNSRPQQGTLENPRPSLSHVLGDPIASRIEQCCEIFTLTGRDRRLQKVEV